LKYINVGGEEGFFILKLIRNNGTMCLQINFNRRFDIMACFIAGELFVNICQMGTSCLCPCWNVFF